MTDGNGTHSDGRRRAGFVLAITGLGLMMAGASAPSPFYPVIQERLGLPPAALTVVFAVYAVTLLAALLTLGSVSDHLGRRPVISAAFVLLTGSVVAFWFAGSLPVLILARAVQGLASGVLIATLSATIADLEPPTNKDAGAAWNTIAPMGGLAFGALASGIALDVAAAPSEIVFGTLAAAYLLAAAGAWILPETSARTAGWLRSLRPQVSIPVAARRMFAISAPAVLAGWATGGLFLSLGASIVHSGFGLAAHVWQGLVVALLAGSGAIAAALIHGRSPRTITVFGTAALAVGTGASLIALAMASFPAYVAAIVIVGAGFGTAFMGVMRSLAPSVRQEERAGTFASIYVVAYLAFGVPAVLAGALTPLLSLGTTTFLYGGAVTLLAASAAVMRIRSAV